MATQDTELFKDKIEISLDGRQVFYLFFGGAVIASLVFVLGVMVGKRVESRAHLERSAATSAALDPLTALDQLSAEPQGRELSFAATLTGGGEAPAPAVDRAIADIEKSRAAARDEAARALAEAPKRPAVADVAPAKPPVAVAPKAEPVAAPVKVLEKAPVKPPEKAVSPPEKAAEKPPAKPPSADKPAVAKAPEKDDGKDRFTLQLSSFQDRGEAEAFLARVRSANPGAYMTEAAVEGKGTYFRIRVGRYSTYQAAIDAKAEFEARQQIIAYVTRL
jgi:DedD protein